MTKSTKVAAKKTAHVTHHEDLEQALKDNLDGAVILDDLESPSKVVFIDGGRSRVIHLPKSKK